MSLREVYQNITSQIWNDINTSEEYADLFTSEEKSRFIMYKILDYVFQTFNIDISIDQYRNIGDLSKAESLQLKKLFFSLQNITKFNPTIKNTTLLNQFKNYRTLENVIKDVILNVIKINEIEVPNVENINDYIYLDDLINYQEGVLKKQDRTGPIDLFTNSELIQDNITQLNMYIDKINEQLYKMLRTGITDNFFDPTKIINGVNSVEILFSILLDLAGGDKKLISDKYDIIVYFLSGNASNTVNPSADMDSYFKSGIFPLKKVNVSDLNKPTKNANLITGTQNIYKVENTQNPFKISPYVNNDLGDYIVNGKKINIKLVGLNYIVKEGSKTKVFKNLSQAKQFIYNGGFDMYNNNKSKFISNASKDFNNKKQPLRLSYSSNIF